MDDSVWQQWASSIILDYIIVYQRSPQNPAVADNVVVVHPIYGAFELETGLNWNWLRVMRDSQIKSKDTGASDNFKEQR